GVFCRALQTIACTVFLDVHLGPLRPYTESVSMPRFKLPSLAPPERSGKVSSLLRFWFPRRPPGRRSGNRLRGGRPWVEYLEDWRLLDSTLGHTTGLTESVARQFVQGVYIDLLQRSPQQDEADAWVAQLQAGVPQEQVVLNLTSGPEFRANLIQDEFWAFLGRAPSSAEAERWQTDLGAGLTKDQLVATILSSDEYF